MTEVEQLRTQMGLTRKELAPLLGVSWRTIENWENGHRNPPAPTIKLLQHLATVTAKIVPSVPQIVPQSKNKKPSK